MNKNNRIAILLLIALLVAASVVYSQHGLDGLPLGLNQTTNRLIDITPLLIGAFIFSGHIEVLLTKDKVSELFVSGKYNKISLYGLGGALGGLIPLGPFFYYPFSVGLLNKGMPFSVVVSFIIGKRLWNFKRLAVEMIYLPPWLVFLRYLITLPIPIMAGFITDFYYKDPLNERHKINDVRKNVRVKNKQ